MTPAAEPPAGIDDLLSQATCAVLVATDPTGPTAAAPGSLRLAGTAWLASAHGHLVTAGHILADLPTDAEIWLRFPGEQPIRADLVQPPVWDKPKALDFALLKLDRPTLRTPLPIQLVTRMQGEVYVRGYGSNLPGAQSGGVASAELAYLRRESMNTFYFAYRSSLLGKPGFSGAAVYSVAAGAVVGLQVEAERNGQTVLAMPLVRISEYWEELMSLARPAPLGRCVVLVPASRGDEGRRQLLDEIVRPVIEGVLNLEVYVSTLGRTTDQDLAELERADVVLADATDDDTNVTYELTVAQGIGTPDVVFVERGRWRTNLPFKAIELDLADPERAQMILAQRLIAVRAVFEAMSEVTADNAITSFFRAPLTQVSAANALAAGYFRSFVRPIARELARAALGAPAEIVVGDRLLDQERARRTALTVVIPDAVEWATDGFIDRYVGNRADIVPARVMGPGWSRPRQLLALAEPEPDGLIRLLDAFPTTMGTIAEAIDERLGVSAGTRGVAHAEAWRGIEGKEIDRFESGLVRRIRADVADAGSVALRDVCTVTRVHGVLPDFVAPPAR